MLTLLDEEFAPITTRIGFLRAPIDDVAEEPAESRRSATSESSTPCAYLACQGIFHRSFVVSSRSWAALARESCSFPRGDELPTSTACGRGPIPRVSWRASARGFSPRSHD